MMESQAAAKWAEVVGPQIAASSVVERVRDGIVYVCCRSSAWCSELSLHKADIIKRLNKAVGAKVLADIRFSARGFTRAAQSARKEEAGSETKRMESVRLEPCDIEAAARAAAQASSEELAERIRQAVTTSKRRERAFGKPT